MPVQIDIDPIIGRHFDLDWGRVLKFRALLVAGSVAPPIKLQSMGMTSVGIRYSLTDGHHRVAAALAEGRTTIAALVEPG
jgi:hypothetical protein